MEETKETPKPKATKKQSKQLEFNKNHRKLSPEVDMTRLLSNQQQNTKKSGIKHQNSLNHMNDKRPSSTIKGSQISSNKDGKNTHNYSTSEYHTVGKSTL